MSETVAKLLESSEGRRVLAAQSSVFFDTYYCGMRYAPHRERWLDAFEVNMARAKQEQQKGALLLLAPRDHGKTEACVTTAVRAICLNRDIRILWISESQGQAEKRMRRVKAVLESAKVQEDWCGDPDQGFGPFRVSDEDRWMATQVYVHRTLQSVDPTLEAVGSGGSVTGGHFDLIMCDDLEDDRTTFSQAQRQKTREWFRGTVRPMLVKGGMIIVVGTRKHHDDLYGHFLDDSTFRVLEDKAISRMPESHKFLLEKDENGREIMTGIDIQGESEVLWEDERPIDYLLRERHAVGVRLFNREFQNEVVDDSSAAIRWEWIRDAIARGRELSLYQVPNVPDLDIVQGWDFALVTDVRKAETRDTDYSVGITWGRDANGVRYLLGIRRVRGLSQANLHREVISEYTKFGSRIRVVSVERNNFGELHYLGLKRSSDLPLRPHLTTGKNKADPWDGVPSLSALFENGKVVFPSRTPEDREAIDALCNELWGLGRERHDDCVMALWIAEVQLRKSAFVHRISFGDGPEMAAAAEEREMGADHLDDEPGRMRVFDGPEEGAPDDGVDHSPTWRGLPGMEHL
jgi:phage terminase large subunit-like protein